MNGHGQIPDKVKSLFCSPTTKDEWIGLYYLLIVLSNKLRK
jgi:hypothetical protein